MKIRPSSQAPSLVAAALCLWGCLITDQRQAGRTVETTNGLTARVVLPSGNPASNIKLMLLDEKDWLTKTKAGESVILDSAITDESGKFTIRWKTGGTAGLMANVEDYGILIHDVSQRLVDSDYQGKIGLRKQVTYQGSISDTGTHARKIFLAGTTYSADVDSAGAFVIKDVPQQQYSVVILRDLPGVGQEYVVSSQVQLDESTDGKRDTVVADTSKTLLIDDFEDADNRNLLGPVLGGGWYDALDDFVLGGNSTLLQPANAAPANWIGAILDGGANRGKSLQVLYKTGDHPGPSQPYSFVYIEMLVGSRDTHYNLSGMDSLTLYSKGSGQMVVELVQQNPPGIALQVVASKTFTLDSNWTLYSVKPSDLAITVGWFPDRPGDPENQTALKNARLPAYTQKPATWQEMGGMVTYLRFKGTGGTEFWLDDIRLHGINLGDLVR